MSRTKSLSSLPNRLCLGFLGSAAVICFVHVAASEVSSASSRFSWPRSEETAALASASRASQPVRAVFSPRALAWAWAVLTACSVALGVFGPEGQGASGR